jgi:hypothetical protein
MILKNAKNKLFIKQRHIHFILYILILLSIGIGIQRFGVIGDIIIPYIKNEMAKLRVLTSNFEGETLYIDIPFENYKKLEQSRNLALKDGILINHKESWVSAEIVLNKDTSKVNIRLKGDWTDHLKTRKWSFRVKVKSKKSVLGMKIFSLQHPSARMWLNEWLFHKALKEEGIISLRYYFVKVVLNGQDLGVYALEEHFDKILIEDNQRKESVIIRFDESMAWQEMLQYKNMVKEIPFSGFGSYTSSPIDAFQTKKISDNPILNNYYINASYLLNGFREKKFSLNDVFDIKKLSKFFVLCDIMSAHHATLWNNMRFYYNPITKKLEPIGYDASFYYSDELIIHSKTTKLNRLYHESILSDSLFRDLYWNQMNKYISNSFSKRFLLKYDNQLMDQVDLLRCEWPNFKLKTNFLQKKEDLIKNLLSPKSSTITFIKNITDTKIIISVGNIQILPINDFNLSISDTLFIPALYKSMIDGKALDQIIEFKDIVFNLPLDIDQIKLDELSFDYKILGTDSILSSKVLAETPNYYKQLKNNRENISNYLKFPFIYQSKDEKKIFFLPGHHIVDKNLFFPKDKEIYIYEGSLIDIIDSSFIFSESPIYMLGTTENPISFFSSDSSGEGLIFLETTHKSFFNHVNFSNFSFKSDLGRGITGAITFYESPVEIRYCSFFNNNTEDALNIIRSDFIIENTTFTKNNFDAFDADFSSGIINNSYFYKSGNDALDFSGSTIAITKVFIENALDKAISIGEKSNVSGSNIQISKCKMGIVSKDMSIFFADSIKIDSTQIAIAVFQKKPEFGPAKINATHVQFRSCQNDYWIENGSELIINNELIHPNMSDFKSLINIEN